MDNCGTNELVVVHYVLRTHSPGSFQNGYFD